MAVLFYPLVDTLRIFIYRAVRGVSPFSADRNHLHHRLIDMGFTQKKTVIILYIVNVLMIALSLSLLYMNATIALLIVGGTALFFAQIPFLIKRMKKRIPKENE
jgi:Flp pilus assembly protein TadB